MKRVLHIHQRYILTGVLLALCLNIVAQNRTAFTSRAQENRSQRIRTTLTSSDTITLDGMGTIYSLSIDATISQPREASFTRIVLEDTDGHDYLVAESDWFRFDSTTVHLDRYCEETALLEGIIPLRLKCYLAGDATITLNGIHSSNQPATRKGGSLEETAESIKLTQVQAIVDRINDYNQRHGKIWVAGITNYATTFYDSRDNASEKKSERIMYENDPYIANLIYYVGGIYEMGERQERALNRDSSSYVPSFSWTNRHGRNWMTPPKDQGDDSNWCELFSTCSVLEALVNLTFNQHIDLDLSEKDLAYNNQQPFGFPTDSGRGLYIASLFGVVNDDGAPLDTVYSSRPTGNEKIQFSTYGMYDPWENGIEGAKGILLQYGPCSSGISRHSMAIVGWGRVAMNDVCGVVDYYGTNYSQVDSSLIGKEYWIFKDSHYQAPDPVPSWYGTHPGYLHLIINNPFYLGKLYYVNSDITSLNYSVDDVACEDLDGDGYYNWGFGQKPNHCPAWASNESDGDDSDSTLGPMNDYGDCEELSLSRPMYQYIANDSILTQPESRSNYLGIIRGATVMLQAQQTFENGTQLLLDNGATLIINGITINGSYIRPYSGSKIIMKNGAKIQKPFEVPLGVELVINSGSIE